MSSQGSRFDSVLVHCRELDAVPFERVRATVASHGVAVVRGLFDPAAMAGILDRIRAEFDPLADRKHDPRDSDAVRRNFQKLQVGANSGIGVRRTLGRFMRVLYNPLWAPDIYGMRAHFSRLAEFRNRLYGLAPQFALPGEDQGLWTCARIQQYPRGGGFMVPHRDMYSQAASAQLGLDYFQLLMPLSRKGVDFLEGGAYVDVDGERFLYEDHCERGDVVIYDGRTVHGVADIDPLQPLELDRFGGRAVAIVSLFRVLSSGTEDYAALSSEAAGRFDDPGDAVAMNGLAPGANRSPS